jgi:hypothetical protein
MGCVHDGPCDYRCPYESFGGYDAWRAAMAALPDDVDDRIDDYRCEYLTGA